jgi:hypothetical protein
MLDVAARVLAGDDGWYVQDPYQYSSYCTYYGPILSIELAHEVAEEVDAVYGHMLHTAMLALREDVARWAGTHA